MFGYFRPNDAHLMGDQIGVFNAYYCRLCYCLRLVGGQKARAFTTFDVTVYSMIVNLVLKQKTPPVLNCQKIKKGNMLLFQDDQIGIRLAYLSLIAFGEKIRDDKIDGNTFRAKILDLIFGNIIKKAQVAEPEMTKLAYDGTEEINVLQKRNSDINEVLAAYGKMASASFSLLGPLEQKHIDLISYIAQWTFFVDMLCDYDDDVRDNQANSLYQEDCPTLDDYFNKNWAYLYKLNKNLTDNIYRLLLEVKDDSIEWIIIYKIVMFALDTVVQSILDKKDVKFHYFKELFKNMKINKERKLYNKKRGESK